MCDQLDRFKRFAGVCAGVVALTACGGGGDGTTTPAAATSNAYAVDAAMTALYTTDNQVLSTGFIDPANHDNFYFTTRITQAGNATFEGVERQVAQVQTTQRRNGVVTSVGTARAYFSASPLTVYGQFDDEGSYSVNQLVKALPSLAQPGESGPWYTSTEYTSADKSSVRQTTDVSWAVAATDAPGIAWVCLEVITREAAHPGMQHASSSCVRSDHEGRLVDAPAPAASAI